MGATSVEIFRLKGELSIRDCPGLTADLLAAIGNSEVLLVDASGLVSADISILQLLIAAHRSAQALSKSVAIQAPEGGVLDGLLRRSGIGAALNGLVWDGDLWTGLGHQQKEQAA